MYAIFYPILQVFVPLFDVHVRLFDVHVQHSLHFGLHVWLRLWLLLRFCLMFGVHVLFFVDFVSRYSFAVDDPGRLPVVPNCVVRVQLSSFRRVVGVLRGADLKTRAS